MGEASFSFVSISLTLVEETKLKMKFAVLFSLLVILPFQAEAASCVGKNVDVWVANGNDLSGDGLQDPDPYVVVKIGSETKKSKTIHSNADPNWWEKLHFAKVTSDVMRI